MDTSITMTLPSKATYNAYHREYYNSKVDKTIRKEQFRANYQKNKQAIKFTEKGAVDITCELVQESAITQIVQVKIIDTGIGI